MSPSQNDRRRTPSTVADPSCDELATDLVKLDAVAGRVGKERLPAGPDRERIRDLEAGFAELGNRGVDVVDLHGEMLTDVRRRPALDEVQLLAARIQPSAREPEVGAVVALHEPESLGIERERLVDVAHVDRHVVHSKRLHRLIKAGR